MYPNNNTQATKPAQTFGNMQDNFVFRLSQFIANDQITIVENLPRNVPIRQVSKVSQKGKQYDVYNIRIRSNGFEADLELFSGELNQIAIACPKGTQNFKGITLVHNGRTFVYLSSDAPLDSNVPVRTDARQPDLNPAPVQQTPQNEDQRDVFARSLVTRIQILNDMGTDAFMHDVLKLASKICPGKEVEIVGYTKTKGLISEKEGGVIKVN